MSNPERKHIEQWVELERENILKDVQQLVRINSVREYSDTPDYPYGKGIAQALDFMLRRGEELGFKTENLQNHCGTISFGSAKESIGLFSHLDVVSVDDHWLFPPFEAYRTKDFIVGRGATDNKGPAIAVLYLLKYLSSCGYSPRHQILQYLGCNEESGMNDIEYYLCQKSAPQISVVPDLSFPICYAEKGMLSFRYTIPFSSNVFTALKGGNAINIVQENVSHSLRMGYLCLCRKMRISDWFVRQMRPK